MKKEKRRGRGHIVQLLPLLLLLQQVLLPFPLLPLRRSRCCPCPRRAVPAAAPAVPAALLHFPPVVRPRARLRSSFVRVRSGSFVLIRLSFALVRACRSCSFCFRLCPFGFCSCSFVFVCARSVVVRVRLCLCCRSPVPIHLCLFVRFVLVRSRFVLVWACSGLFGLICLYQIHT